MNKSDSKTWELSEVVGSSLEHSVPQVLLVLEHTALGGGVWDKAGSLPSILPFPQCYGNIFSVYYGVKWVGNVQ